MQFGSLGYDKRSLNADENILNLFIIKCLENICRIQNLCLRLPSQRVSSTGSAMFLQNIFNKEIIK